MAMSAMDRLTLPVHRAGISPMGEIAGSGIGLRSCHVHEVLTGRPDVPWFELLADNHLANRTQAALYALKEGIADLPE